LISLEREIAGVHRADSRACADRLPLQRRECRELSARLRRHDDLGGFDVAVGVRSGGLPARRHREREQAGKQPVV
jgi:hypothetical protein